MRLGVGTAAPDVCPCDCMRVCGSRNVFEEAGRDRKESGHEGTQEDGAILAYRLICIESVVFCFSFSVLTIIIMERNEKKKGLLAIPQGREC